MADELMIRAFMRYVSSTKDIPFGESTTVDVSGTKVLVNQQTVGTSAEALEVGDMTTPGVIMLKNLDDTNFVELRDGADGADLVKILAGETSGPWRLATTTPYVIADTASVEVEYMLVEN